MSLRILLMVVGAVSMVFGLFFLIAPEAAIEEFQVGTPSALLRLSICEIGGALVSIAVIDLFSASDKASKALRGVVAGNILFFLFNTGLDFTETFPKTGLWYVVTILKSVFILALTYFLFASKWSEVTSDRIGRV